MFKMRNTIQAGTLTSLKTLMAYQELTRNSSRKTKFWLETPAGIKKSILKSQCIGFYANICTAKGNWIFQPEIIFVTGLFNQDCKKRFKKPAGKSDWIFKLYFEKPAGLFSQIYIFQLEIPVTCKKKL